MARLARLVVPGYPHHVTQRGVRSIDIFTNDQDRLSYLQFMAEEAGRCGVSFMAWCLMTNHVHLIAVPRDEQALARAIGNAHRRYTRMKNFAEGKRGYLFQGRFASCVLDQQHLMAAGRYVERNPVAAGLVVHPQDYRWSSCRYHCRLTDYDPLMTHRTLPDLVDDWANFLTGGDDAEDRTVRAKTRTGRPAGDDRFVFQLETLSGRALRPESPGRPSKG
jgi:putative transposase